MKVVACVKEVLDPDAVNSYALAGQLTIGDDGRTIVQSAIPRLMNGFDEQAIEAALRLRDAGARLELTVVTVGEEATAMLRHAVALGADETVVILEDPAQLDPHRTARLLAAFLRSLGEIDLVLCGRQASDDDQGVVPALIGEALGLPLVTLARAVELAGGDPRTLRVTRVTPEGDEVVEVKLPAVVTVSNELGEPRFPTAARKIAARRTRPVRVEARELLADGGASGPRAVLERLYVPAVQGHCEWIEGESAREQARGLVERLRAEGLIGG